MHRDALLCYDTPSLARATWPGLCELLASAWLIYPRREAFAMVGLLWTIAVVLVVLWLLGLLLHVAGGLIHLLLLVAIIVIVYNLVVCSCGRTHASNQQPTSG